MPRVNTNGISFWGKVGARLCPVLTAKSSWTRPETLERLARDFGKNSEVRKAIAANENVNDKALELLNMQRLTFVHINDIHATYMEDFPGQNPLSRLRAYVDGVREKNPYTIFTFGGDFFEKGSVAELLSNGRSTQEVFELMGFDIAVIGNHDFAWSKDQVMTFSKTKDRNDKTEMLLSNAEYFGNNRSEYGAKVFTTLERGKLKIGFFGMVSKGYNELDEQTDEDYYPETLRTRHDYVECAKEIVEAERENVDVMVMLSHIGLKADKKVGDEVADLDVVLSGHSHDPLEKPVVDRDGTIIAQTDAYARNFVRMDLIVDMEKSRVVHHRYDLIQNTPVFLTSDAGMAEGTKAIVKKYAKLADMPLASVGKNCSKPEIAKVAANAAIHHLEVDAAIVDTKMVWEEEWKPGDLTQQNLVDTFEVEREPAGTPGFSCFYTVDITGDNLNKMLNSTKHPGRFVYSLPPEHRPDEILELALNKKQAQGHIDRYFGEGIKTVSEKPSEGCEIWEAVDAYGRHQKENYRNIEEE